MRIGITALSILLLAGSAHTLCGAEKKAAKKPGGHPQMPPALVVAGTVQTITNTASKEFIGNIEADEEVDIQPRISGFITGIMFKEGSLVKKGDLLITIEDTTYRAKVMAAKAVLEQSKVELRYAESNYHRQKLLANKKAISTSNLEDAERLVNFRRAKYNQEQAELLNAENELSYTKIYAPITGRIGKVKYTKGNYVSLNSQPLAKIVSVDPILLKFSLSERTYQNLFKSIVKLNKNINIRIKLSNGDIYKEKGEISLVDNVVDKNTGTISVWYKVGNPEMILIPGGYVNAMVSEHMDKPVPTVKVSAVMTDSKGSYVYVLGVKNIPVRRAVTLGDMIGDLYIVKKGLSPGERVIIDGTHKVFPGVPVKIANTAKK